MVNNVETYLKKSAYSIKEISDLLQTDQDTIVRGYLGKIAPDSQFLLHDRALHVFSEALRVENFVATTTSHMEPHEKLTKLGKLMNESHESCSKLYDCSCPELDQLTEICRYSLFYLSCSCRLFRSPKHILPVLI